MTKNKKLKVLVMSVGEYSSNGTAKYMKRLGAPKGSVIVCLPKAKSENAQSYIDQGIEVYIYDQDKYINEDFEYFGFKPRNCGGVGRQGIAEATEKYDNDDTICLELDDDTGSLNVGVVRDGKLRCKVLRDFSDLEEIMNCLDRFYETTGIYLQGKTGGTIPDINHRFSNRKIFNNFIMRKECPTNYWGFAALASDDYRFNICHQFTYCCPMRSHRGLTITFTANQGDRKDGNAPLYNSDCSWKKSFALKMICPWAARQRFSKETNRWLYREDIMSSNLVPPIYVSDENGEVVGREE